MKNKNYYIGGELHDTAGTGRIIQSFFTSAWQRVKQRAVFWRWLFSITALVAYFYIFMEWLFIITMPSFMSILSLSHKVEVYLIAGLVSALLCLAVLLLFIVLDTVATVSHLSHITTYLGVAIPTIIVSALALLLIDNFTYTVFKFGISTATGIWRGGYGGLFILLFVVIYLRMLNFLEVKTKEKPQGRSKMWLFYIPVGLLVISAGLALARLDTRKINPLGSSGGAKTATRAPNIILLGSDGVNADFLSVYGYDKDTTPRLRELASSSLVAENAFTNAANTAGSVISIMTSKLPTQTRLLYPPDILSGVNAYQHLPGILKNEGYQTIEFGTPYYVDAYSFNLQDGFDRVNNRTKSASVLDVVGQRLGYENVAYFLGKLIERISDRILHIFYIREMENPYVFIVHPVASLKDTQKVSQLLFAVDATVEPVFIHAHLLGTHGGYFSLKNRVFSKGERQTRPWMPDFYADTILAFDQYVGEVINHLKATGEWENTILIIYTDHNQKFEVNQRIPLIIHFPGDEFAGRITSPAQNIDIAPTILDYLGLTKPDWMRGESLLKDLDPNRLVFSAGTQKIKQNEDEINVLDPNSNQPPFYQFSYINIVNCQKWYTFNLASYTWTMGEVLNYVEPCDKENMFSLDEIKQRMKSQLAQDGFDVSSLP